MNETINDAINRTAKEQATRDGQIMVILAKILKELEEKKDK